MHSPFKLSAPFQQEDSHAFFGRADETRQLYDFVKQNRFTMLYGTSGTGKTSLIRCGLSNCFESTDWLPLFIRRGNTILESLREELLRNAPTASPDASIVELVASLYAQYARPVYLIFDQLEELLVFGDDAELLEFIDTMKQLSEDTTLDCHILLATSWEFQTRLITIVRAIPAIAHSIFEVKHLSEDKLREVMLHAAKQFNIDLEDPERNAEQMIAALRADNAEISLSFLQVYLDMLWRECYQHTYPGADAHALEEMLSKKQYPKLTFTTAEIEAFGQIEAVLSRFLSQQVTLIQAQVHAESPDNPNLVAQVLDCFVTEEGTSRMVPYFVLQKEVCFGNDAPEFLRSLPKALATKVFRLLEKSRMLYSGVDIPQMYYLSKGDPKPSPILYLSELTHGTLAALIDRQRSKAQHRRNEFSTRLRNTYRAYLDEIQLVREQLKIGEEPRRHFMASAQTLRAQLLGGVHDFSKEGSVAMMERELRAYTNAVLTRLESYTTMPDERIETFWELAEMGMRLVYTLHYADALQKLSKAAGLEIAENTRRDTLTAPLSELLFFFAEGGRRFELAREAAGLLLGLGQTGPLAELLQRCTEEQWSSSAQFEPLLAALPDYTLLKQRYYPTMHEVPTVMDTVPEGVSKKKKRKKQEDATTPPTQLQSYEIAETPVTFYQFALYCESTDLPLLNRTPFWGQYGDHPMVNVAWTETAEYVNWLNVQNGLPPCYTIDKSAVSDPVNGYSEWEVELKEGTLGYRLPTSEEWDLAAIGGVGGKTHAFIGGDNVDEVSWYKENSGDVLLSADGDAHQIYSHIGRTHPVGQKKPNALGLYDMAGNVFEWCWEITYQEISVEPYEAKSYSVRGGAWSANDLYLNVDSSMGMSCHRDNSIGFRLVRTKLSSE